MHSIRAVDAQSALRLAARMVGYRQRLASVSAGSALAAGGTGTAAATCEASSNRG